MKDKETLVLFIENKEYIDMLSDAQAGRLFKAIFTYADEGVIPDFGDDTALYIMFAILRKPLDYTGELCEVQE